MGRRFRKNSCVQLNRMQKKSPYRWFYDFPMSVNAMTANSLQSSAHCKLVPDIAEVSVSARIAAQ